MGKNPVGVMQGRLLPKFEGRYQAHPVGCWQNEFGIAAGSGLDCIEFILDFNDCEANPLMSHTGLDEIRAVVEQTGVVVRSVCADYFMEAPLHHENSELAEQGQQVLGRLVDASERIGLTDIVIPCVDQSRLASPEEIDRFVARLTPLVERAERAEVNLALETDLAPVAFSGLLERFDSCRVTVNYDTGNSASLGYDPVEELSCYGDRISDVHIKDRLRNGGSVVLGSGNASFERFFSALRLINFTGPLILQAYRDDEGLIIFRQQLEWFRTKMAEWNFPLS